MNEVVTQLVASAIIAIFGGVSGQFLKRMKAQRDEASRARFMATPPQPAPPHAAPYAAAAMPGWQPPAAPALIWQPPAPSVNAGQVLLHTGILQFAVNVVGFIIGFTVAVIGRSSGASDESISNTSTVILLLLGSLTTIAFFFAFGMRVDPAIRWRHLTFVALGTVVLTVAVNSLALQTAITAGALIFAFVQVFVMMGIGGGLAAAFGPKRRPLAPQAYAQPSMPLPGAPYGYAAPPSTPLSYPPPQSARPAAGAPPGYPAPYGAPPYPPQPGPGAGHPAAPPPYGAVPPYGPPPYAPQYPPRPPAQGPTPGQGQAPGGYQPGAGQPVPPPSGYPQTPPPAQPPYAAPPYPPANDQRGNAGSR